MRTRTPLQRHAHRIALAALLATTLACGPTIVPMTLTPTGTAFQPPTSTPAPTPTITPTVESIAPPTPLPTQMPIPTATPSTPWLPGEIRVFPGPMHYEGDVLSVEVIVHNLNKLPPQKTATLSVDGQLPLPSTPVPIHSALRDDLLLFRWAWDTTGEEGRHELTARVPLNRQGDVQELVTFVEILPPDRRPHPERTAEWARRDLPCCHLSYVTGTAAERDIDLIADRVQQSVTAVERQVGFAAPDRPTPIVLIDNVWGNGAYTNAELVISYVDRAYTGIDLDTIVRHEATHWAARSLHANPPTILAEGTAVYVAGGHYRPEPIPRRAAALLDLGRYIPLAELADGFRAQQHEVAYLEAGALVAYLVDTYNWQQVMVLYAVRRDARGAEWLDQALRLVFNTGLEQVEQDFIAWLQSHPPDEQLDDLRLTIDLYDTIRRYQDLYAPYQEALPRLDEALELGLTADFMREPTAPENVALEAMFVAAHQALAEGRYIGVEALLDAVNATLDDGNFTREPVGDYLSITRLLAKEGYEVQRINIAGSQATVQAIQTWPQLETLTLTRVGDEWQIAN
jgi:hypothetical protein